MADSLSTGPIVSAGPLVAAQGTGFPQEYDLQFGPSAFYQGQALPDVRYTINGSSSAPGKVVGFLDMATVCVVDTAPAASAATPVNLAAAQTVTSAVAMTLVSTNASGITCNMPFVNFSSGAVVSTGICLDYGFGTLNVTSASTTATPSGTTIQNYYPGMWIAVAITATNILYTLVTAVGATTITLLNAPTGTNASAPVGTANFWALPPPAIAGANFTPNAHSPYLRAGFMRPLDPLQSCTRGVGIAASATASCNGTTNNITISGADLYGQAQTEVIVPVQNTVVYGNKAWKWITSAVTNFTDTTAGHTYSIGTSDLFGMNVRSDRFEALSVWWNQTAVTTNSSTAGVWTAANVTSPNPNNADAKGTFQPSARGPSATPSGTAANGTIRLVMFLTPSLFNAVYASNSNAVPFFGVTPS